MRTIQLIRSQKLKIDRDESIVEILGGRGEIEVFEEDYNIFSNGAGRSVKSDIKERIFYCKVMK